MIAPTDWSTSAGTEAFSLPAATVILKTASTDQTETHPLPQLTVTGSTESSDMRHPARATGHVGMVHLLNFTVLEDFCLTRRHTHVTGPNSSLDVNNILSVLITPTVMFPSVNHVSVTGSV